MGTDAPVVRYELTAKQGEALAALDSPNIDELMYGGAKGGGKSVFGCIWCFLEAKRLIKRYKIPRTKYPLVIGFMGRKQSVDFTNTTLLTWKKMIPEEAYALKEQKKLIVIDDAVAYHYGGLDDSDMVRKFNSAEYCRYFLDQAEECSEQDVGMLRGAMRLKIGDHEVAWKGLLTANPAMCWLKGAFITTPQARTRFIRALPSDNTFLPSTYVDQLKKAFSFKPELLHAYLHGSWEDLEGAFLVIRARDVEECVNNGQQDKTIIKKVTVCDVAGESEGGDETVIYDLENTRIVDSEIYTHRGTMDTVGRLHSHAHRNRSNTICVDRIGIGAGVYDRLNQMYEHDTKMTIIGFCGSEKARDPVTYANYKTEAWFNAAQKFYNRKCDIPHDPTLISQLSSVTYHYTSGEKIIVDRKEKLREKMRHSPDRAEAYVMGLDALDQALPVSKIDGYATHRPSDDAYQFNPATC